jgi:hypothetical protein
MYGHLVVKAHLPIVTVNLVIFTVNCLINDQELLMISYTYTNGLLSSP